MKTTIISFIIFILLFGAASYFTRNTTLPVLSNIGKDISNMISSQEIESVQELNVTETLIETETDTSTTQKEVANISDTATNLMLNCGTSDSSKIKKLNYEAKEADGSTTKVSTSDYDSSEAIACMGKALTNNCQDAEVVMLSEKASVTQKITKKGEVCTFEFKNSLKNNTYTCNISTSLIPQIPSCNSFMGNEACKYFKIENSLAHKYMNTLFSLAMASASPSREVTCTGDPTVLSG